MANVLPDIKKDYNGTYPDDSIPPEQKDFKWHLECGKALYQKQRSLVYLSNNRRLDYITNRMYADGNQTTTKYVDKLAKLKKQGKPVSYRDLNWGIISTAPKVINAILGYWEKLDYQIFFDCINPMAAQDKKFIEATLKAKLALKDFNQQIAEITQTQGAPPDIMMPENLEEIQAFLQDGFRLPYEMEMELGVTMVQEENGWRKEMRRRIRREFIVNGCAGTKTWIDRISQRVKMRECDVVNMVVEDFYGCDGDASKGIGEVITMTLAECKLEWGDQFTQEEYYKIGTSALGEYGNPLQLGTFADYVNTDSQYNTYNNPWNNLKIRVLDWEIWSCDRIKKGFTDKGGFTRKFDIKDQTIKPYKKKRKREEDGTIYTEEVIATDIKTVRGGKWIINSDFMADWGKKCDIARPNENKRECYREFKFYRVANKSILESIMPILDMLQTSILYKQNEISRSMPSGFNIEMKAFENVLMDGKIKNSDELFTIASETGNIIYRRKNTMDDEGRVDSSNPVEWVERNIGPALNAWWVEIDKNIQLIRTISGINEMMDASTPDNEAPVGTSEIALQGAENTLSPLTMGFIDLEEKLAYMIALKLQVIARNGNISGYATLGNGFKTLIELGDNISMLSYATRVQALPTVEQKRVIMTMAQEAVTSNLKTGEGGIDPADFIWLEDFLIKGGNLKLAYLYFNKFRKKAQDKMNRDADQREKANTDRLMATAQKAEEEKRKTALQELDIDKELDDHQTSNKMKVIRLEADLGLRQGAVDTIHKKNIATHEKTLEVQEKV